ncbi:MAG: alanine dehydrogenase [candidate division KSB1 bacterium]|nr:alanine dehydrogenase [candidate division KSB1 bacterium]MDQ7064383.1 alanine dehydrogenase [candidate division KSB1 bacterium]
MKIGIVKERNIEEKRVPITPAGVYTLVREGHEVYIEEDAGEEAGFSDEAYFVVGAKHAESRKEIFDKVDMVVKVMPPDETEAQLLKPKQILLSFFQLTMRTEKIVNALLKKKVYSFGTELIPAADGSYPVLVAMSEIAGRMLPQIAGRYLESTYGGRGIVLGGGPGVPPASVVILGGGAVGTSAAQAFLGLGCQVFVLDKSITALRNIDRLFQRRAITMMANPYDIEKVARFADVLIGAIYVPGERTPRIVARDVVMQMKEGSVIIDLSIDQGGCIETCRPTTLSEPTYVEHGVIHYCVPNILSSVARTASHALNNVTLGFVRDVARWGVEEALRRRPNYQHGLLTFDGVCTHQGLADLLGIESVVPASLIVSESHN